MKRSFLIFLQHDKTFANNFSIYISLIGSDIIAQHDFFGVENQ